MASHTFCTGPLRGTPLRTLQANDRQRRLKNTITVAGSSKKLNTYDDKWSKVRHLQCCSCHPDPTLHSNSARNPQADLQEGQLCVYARAQHLPCALLAAVLQL